MLVKLLAGICDCLLWFYRAICVYFQLDALFKRMRFFVASEPNPGVFKQLMAYRIAKRVILLTDHNSGGVLLS